MTTPANDLAAKIARAIFKLGDEPNSPCSRMQFKGGEWPDNERNQGGVGENPLAEIIAAVLAAELAKATGQLDQSREMYYANLKELAQSEAANAALRLALETYAAEDEWCGWAFDEPLKGDLLWHGHGKHGYDLAREALAALPQPPEAAK